MTSKELNEKKQQFLFYEDKADFVNGVVETRNSVYHLELKNKEE